MSADSTILVGYSKGGVISREASKSVAPKGIVTMSTPNGGLPLASNLAWTLDQLNRITWQVADVLGLAALEAWNDGMAPAEVFFLASFAYAGATYAQDAINDHLLTSLSNIEPFVTSFQPGSSFLGGLPTGGANRYSISVQQTAEAALTAPWSAIGSLSQAAATSLQATTFAAGYWTWSYAVDAYYDIDWASPEGWLAFFWLGSAESLGTTLMNVPYLSCAAVSTVGASGCLANDGLIPTYLQEYPGGQNVVVVGPTHVRVQNDAAINNLAMNRVALILAS